MLHKVEWKGDMMINYKYLHTHDQSGYHYTALLWQKVATGKSPKSEKVMFLDWT